jgi:stringent starvation protein B
MTSTRPYLLRAFYDWIVDNGCTPHIVVNAILPDVEVPLEYVESGQIVLNVSLSAVQGLILGDQSIEFKARFSGVVRHVYIPIRAVLAVYAKENGRGMVFSEEEEGEGAPPPSGPVKGRAKETPTGVGKGKGKDGRPPFLKVVK